MRRLAALLALLAALSPGTAASAAENHGALRRAVAAGMGAAGPASGAYVVDLTDGRTLYARRATGRRILASNTKLFTTVAALEQFGAAGTLQTRVLGSGALDGTGVWSGNLYLRGSGDPSFGTASFAKRSYGVGSKVEDLAAALAAAGITEVSGRIYGDESAWDSLRGGPDSGYGLSGWVGPLSALSFNRGLLTESGRGWQGTPPLHAARALDAALEEEGVRVRLAPRAGATPDDAQPLTFVVSPEMARLVRITNKYSDNFYAEQLLKAVGAEAAGLGTTRGGAGAAMAAGRGMGAPSKLVDGSGLARGNRASPKAVVRLLSRARDEDWYSALYDSLAIAGVDGTLHDRMRGTAAKRRCRAKTGTIVGVSTLSGYCTSVSGDVIAFSFLMNGVNVNAARRIQNRMAAALARYG